MLHAALGSVLVVSVAEAALALPAHETVDFFFLSLGTGLTLVCTVALVALRHQRKELQRLVLEEAEALVWAAAHHRRFDGC